MKWLTYPLFLLCITGIIFEITLRCAGLFTPSHKPEFLSAKPITFDSEIGWINKPGIYDREKLQPYTIRNDYSRAVKKGEFSLEKKPRLDFYGCSFTNGGWNIADEDAYPGQVQSMTKDYAVRNFGIWGYGTIQSQMLARRISMNDESVSEIYYGFVGFHTVRNAGEPNWVMGMSQTQSDPRFFLPVGRMDQDTLHIANHYPHLWIFRDYFRTVRALEFITEAIAFNQEHVDLENVTVAAIADFSREVHEHHKQFHVITLADRNPKMPQMLSSLKAQGIDIIDCQYPGDISQFALPEDGHPNRELHKFWAECISRHQNHLAAN